MAGPDDEPDEPSIWDRPWPYIAMALFGLILQALHASGLTAEYYRP